MSGALVTINPGAALDMNTATYYVEVPSGAFEDLTGNAFAGISGPEAWNFTTLNYIPLASLPALNSNPALPLRSIWISTDTSNRCGVLTPISRPRSTIAMAT